MTDKELRRLSRSDLLELLLVQRKENEQLRCILDQTQAQLADRTIRLDNVGSIAEASLQLSGIFEAAQDSCQYYLDNIKRMNDQQTEICQQMENETKEKCERMVEEAERKAQACWENCSAKIKQLVDSFTGLQQAMDMYSSLNSKPNETPAPIFGKMY